MEATDTPQTEVQGLTEQQATEELLKRWTSKEEASEEETTGEPEEEQPQGDATPEEEPEEEPDPEGEVEIDVAGEKFKLPKAVTETVKRIEAKAKEVEAGATRKFQEAADLRKAVETQTKAVVELQRVAQANAQLLGDHAMVTRRIAQLESIDINSTDAETLTRLNAEYNQLQAAERRIQGQYQENVSKMRQEEAKAQKAKEEHSEKMLSTHLKGWGPEMKKSLAEYALSRGAPAEVLQGITDAWMVEILADAMYGRQMKESKPNLTKRVQDTPKTLKPTGSGTKSATVAKADQAVNRLKKTGRIEDAAMALLARAQAKRK